MIGEKKGGRCCTSTCGTVEALGRKTRRDLQELIQNQQKFISKTIYIITKKKRRALLNDIMSIFMIKRTERFISSISRFNQADTYTPHPLFSKQRLLFVHMG